MTVRSVCLHPVSSSSTPGFIGHVGIPAYAAAKLTDSALRVTGDSRDAFYAGQDNPDLGRPLSAIDGADRGALLADSRVRFVSNHGAPPSTGATVFRRIVACSASGDATGEVVTGSVISPASNLVVLLAGRPVRPVATPIGALFVEDWIAALVGVQDATQQLPFRFAVPALPSLRWAPVGLQAVNLYATTGIVELSNPVVLTVARRFP